jgi:hypothetical protein
MRDGASGRSRGFGFLTFRDPKVVNTVMVKEHFLDGKIVREHDLDQFIMIAYTHRLIQNVRFQEKSKKELQRSLLAVLVPKPLNKTLKTSSHSSDESLMLHS